VERYKISPDIYPNILISLTEAVNNAIHHGNGEDSNKSIIIQLIKGTSKICLNVTDEGEGFDHTKLPDPTAPENLTKCGGRGVFLMHQLSDHVCYKNNGCTVELTFHL
jgi:serine/threonine-protein kinase RsbW